jgi:kynurenine formamidase
MQNKLIDLSHLLNVKMTVYPGTLSPEFKVLNTIDKHGFSELRMNLVSHTGTHIDAPCHVLKDKKSLDRFSIDKFQGQAIVIPCQDRKEISLDYIQTYEEWIAEIDFILFFTGWQHKWNTKEYFDDCPILTAEAARWLTKFHLKGIGIDAFSLDKISPAEKITPENLPNHYILLEKEILLIENLTHLDKLPVNVFTFQCLPLNIENADGSPVRAIAIVKE